MSRKPTRLADISEIITKGTTPTTLGFKFVESGVPFLRVQNIDGGSVNYGRDTLFIDEKTHEALKRSQIKPGDVLVSIAGTIGRAGIVPDDASALNCNQAVAIVRPTKHLYRPFLRMWLESADAQRQMRRAMVTGTISNLSLTQVRNLKIQLPPLAEQRRIAEVLDRAEALRAKRRAALAQVNSLTQSLFLDLFGDPAANPKGWPVSSLAEVCSVAGQYGSNVPAIEFSPSLPRYIRITDIHSEGKLALGRVSPGGTRANWSDLKLEDGDVLFARSGATVGKTYRYSSLDGDCVFAGYLIRFRPKPTKLLSEVLFHFTRTEAYARWVVARQRVVAQPNINAKQYGAELNIPLPPLDLQREFARRVGSVEKLKTVQRASLAEMDALFATLQHRAFRGEL